MFHHIFFRTVSGSTNGVLASHGKKKRAQRPKVPIQKRIQTFPGERKRPVGIESSETAATVSGGRLAGRGATRQ
jgi:hypothetical protein